MIIEQRQSESTTQELFFQIRVWLILPLVLVLGLIVFASVFALISGIYVAIIASVVLMFFSSDAGFTLIEIIASIAFITLAIGSWAGAWWLSHKVFAVPVRVFFRWIMAVKSK